MSIKRLFISAIPELSLGVFLIFISSFGQTFFISLFSGQIRSEFNLSHGMFGIFYSLCDTDECHNFLLAWKNYRPI